MSTGTFLVLAPAFAGIFFAFWLFTRKLSENQPSRGTRRVREWIISQRVGVERERTA